MVKLLCTALVFIASVLLAQTLGLPTPDEERYMDKEYNRELMNLYLAMQNPQLYNVPCKYYSLNSVGAPMPKRNSELINSLLSLPKSMNEAGK